MTTSLISHFPTKLPACSSDCAKRNSASQNPTKSTPVRNQRAKMAKTDVGMPADELKSFADQLTEHTPKMRAFAISLCGSQTVADDLVQEALLRAWNNRDKFEMGTNLKAWLLTILRNIYFN